MVKGEDNLSVKRTTMLRAQYHAYNVITMSHDDITRTMSNAQITMLHVQCHMLKVTRTMSHGQCHVHCAI